MRQTGCPRCQVPSGAMHTLECPIRAWNMELHSRGMWPPPAPMDLSELLLALCMTAAVTIPKATTPKATWPSTAA